MLIVGIAAALALIASPAFAYIGPGAGIPVLGAVWGVVVTIFVVVGALLLWPLRLLLRRRGHKRPGPADVKAAVAASDSPSEAAPPSSR